MPPTCRSLAVWRVLLLDAQSRGLTRTQLAAELDVATTAVSSAASRNGIRLRCEPPGPKPGAPCKPGYVLDAADKVRGPRQLEFPPDTRGISGPFHAPLQPGAAVNGITPAVPPRHFDCFDYEDCLTIAIVNSWPSWHCAGCTSAPPGLKADPLEYDDPADAAPAFRTLPKNLNPHRS